MGTTYTFASNLNTHAQIPFIFVLLLSLAVLVFGPKRVTISGTIKDASTGETLIGATMRIKELET